LIVCAVALLAVSILVAEMIIEPAERARSLGLLLFLGAVGAMSLGIGWGRSGFSNDRMGLAVRYGWIVWPAVAALYFLGLLCQGWQAVKWLPLGLFAAAVLMFPFNAATGIIEGEKHLERAAQWEADVRAGLSGNELVEKYVPNWPEYLKDRIREGTRLLREHGISYYRAHGRSTSALPTHPNAVEQQSP
jgi:hypothetical protein